MMLCETSIGRSLAVVTRSYTYSLYLVALMESPRKLRKQNVLVFIVRSMNV